MAKKQVAKTAKPRTTGVGLSEVASLLRLPPGVKDQKLKKGGKRVRSISITDLPEAGYIPGVESLITLSPDRHKSLEKYLIQPFDVIMSIQGSVGTVGVVPETFTGNWLANISLLVVRFAENPKDNAIALSMFLKSTKGQETIAKLQKGDSIKRVNVKEFAAIRIPALTPALKKSSATAFKEEVNVKARIDELYARISQIRKQYP